MMQPVILALFETALRSALLGLLVSAGVGLFRLRDLKAETAIWTLVLALTYGGGVIFFIARLGAGLVLLARLYLRAEPAPEAWARGRACLGRGSRRRWGQGDRPQGAIAASPMG